MSTITTVNPATGQELETYDVMTEAEATRRLEACHTAFLEWRKTDHSERERVLKAIAGRLREIYIEEALKTAI